MITDRKKYNREYMRKYNATGKGAKYNRNHTKNWRKNNPGRLHGKRPTQLSAEYREAIIYFLINRDGLNCSFCGEIINNYEEIGIDHKTPVMLGGKNRMENLRLAHRTCNHKAGLLVRKITAGY